MNRLIEMEAFANVIDQGGFTDAARKMGISKSAVSKHVTSLENRLGARLLHRTTRRVGPTDIGVAYYDRARRVLSDAGDADALVKSMQDEPTGLLRLTAATDFGTILLSPIVSNFLIRNPAVQVGMDLSNRVVDLISEGFDLAIRIGDLPDSTLIRRKLAESTVRICASPYYLSKFGRPQQLSDLTNHKLLHFTNDITENCWKLKMRTGEIKQVKGGVSLRVNDGQSLLSAAKCGLGLAVLPSFLYRAAMKAGEIVDAMPNLNLMPQPIFAVYPPGQFVQPKTRAFLDYLANVLADKGPETWE